MTVKKLTDADRKEILDLYRHTGETTSTLAERYGVSNSTISRYLKVTLPEEEYEILISAKRAARTSSVEQTPSTQPEPEVAVTVPVESEPTPPAETTPTPTVRRRRTSKPQTEDVIETPTPVSLKQAQTEDVIEPPTPVSHKQAQTEDVIETPTPVSRKQAQTEDVIETPTPVSQEVSLTSRQDTPLLNLSQPSVQASSPTDEDVRAGANTIAQMFGEELLDESEDLEDLDDEDDLEDLDDEDEDDLDEDIDEQPILRRRLPVESIVRVLPLSEAILPRTCYLVIDRAAELITRPLRDFGELGQIPSQEFQQRTLPVFDNHRVARRFSSKRDRVIKVPDSRMFQKVRTHLQAKGITRLLFDGRVYSLSIN